MNIGENIRKFRKSKKMTLKELGTKVGLSEQAIGQYERGERQPTILILSKISSELNVNLYDITGESPAVNTYYNEVAKELLEEFERNGIKKEDLNIEKLKKVIQMYKIMENKE